MRLILISLYVIIAKIQVDEAIIFINHHFFLSAGSGIIYKVVIK